MSKSSPPSSDIVSSSSNANIGIGSPSSRQSHSTFSINKNGQFEFEVPKEAPVFIPTVEEFKNPLAYISKIRPIAERFGICKIKPPSSWQPPFAVDVDKLRFTPRVQRLNELEAKTRVKLNFLDQIAKFWELQGSSLKIPMIDRKALDLYSLHRAVQEEGGIEQMTKDRKWSKIACRLGYPVGKNVGSTLKEHYERILYPFDLFTSGKSENIIKQQKLEQCETDDLDYKQHGIVSRQKVTPPSMRRSQRTNVIASSVKTEDTAAAAAAAADGGTDSKPTTTVDSSDDSSKNTELRRLLIHGAGPKMSGVKGKSRMNGGGSAKKRTSGDLLAKYICHICNRGDVEEAMLLCDGCDGSYHTFCLIPPLTEIPAGDWRCPKCVVEEVNKPTAAFGFEQAQREYTLQQFGEMADQFKADYFNIPVHLVPTELVEREFWRIVSSIDEDVAVEYGADLHTMDHGSGFPTKSSLYLQSNDREYAESSWNLNNMPLLEESILGHINADISGMKVPWMYVGMCFSAFCWHNEDHWSYSINYLHWGEPKTWYGVPGNKAEAFENTMKRAAPELFQSQPDLLHQLVTIMNPNILMNDGVPVCRTDQHAGEFVITFPRAYHTGFNQGYNFAEAVNFAPADWMKMGRECINHYSTLRRFCVFSHDELVCKMALEPDRLNLGIATACYLDMAEMVDCEKKLRKSLLEWGVTKAEREPFELLPDDERLCEVCKTTCFLSAVTCSCISGLVCLRHYSELCKCPPDKHTLKYRYTLDELPLMLRKLKVKAESFETWLSRVRDVIDPHIPTKISLEELQQLVQEAEEKKFPGSMLLERLNSAVLEAEKCVTVIQQLDINKMRTRKRTSCEFAKYKLTMEELGLFVQEIDNLCCVIQEGQSVRELQQMGKEFVEMATFLLKEPLNVVDESAVVKLIEYGNSLCIELPQLKALKYVSEQVHWLNCVREARESTDKIPLATIEKLLHEGLNILPDHVLEKELCELQSIKRAIEKWEQNVNKCFDSGTYEISEIEQLLEEAEHIEGNLPMQPTLKNALDKAKEWLAGIERLQTNENYPYFETLENVVNRGKTIPFHMEELKRMEDHLDNARAWKQRTSRTFLLKNTQFDLMEALSPRTDAIMSASTSSMLEKSSASKPFDALACGPEQMVISFKIAQEKELREMHELRRINLRKNPAEDKFCVCQQRFYGNMYHCQLCKDWFHCGCVPAPRTRQRSRASHAQIAAAPSTTTTTTTAGTPSTTATTTNTSTAATTSGNILVPLLTGRERDREPKYLCPSCMRSRRPRLETILSLLVSLQRLPIRMPEGEALQCLTERAMNWQDRARQALAIDDVVAALATLSSLAQKISASEVSAASATATTTTIAASVSKTTVTAADGGQQPRRIVRSSESSKSDSDAEELSISHNVTADDIVNEAAAIGDCPMSPNRDVEHAYSVPTLTPIKSDAPLVTLQQSTREHLEDLMMEGDLLEVTLDETLHIWRILNAGRFGTSDLTFVRQKYKIMSQPNEPLVSANIKKRRSEDNRNTNAMSSPKTTAGNAAQSSVSDGAPKVKRGRKSKADVSSSTIAAAAAAAQSSTSGEVVEKVKKKKRARKNQVQQEEFIATGSTSDNDEDCSSAHCKRPTGREVDWVQCDGGCNKWFHMMCVGLVKTQIKPDDEYFCKNCKKAKKTTTKPGGLVSTQQQQLSAASNDNKKSIDDRIDKVIDLDDINTTR